MKGREEEKDLPTCWFTPGLGRAGPGAQPRPPVLLAGTRPLQPSPAFCKLTGMCSSKTPGIAFTVPHLTSPSSNSTSHKLFEFSLSKKIPQGVLGTPYPFLKKKNFVYLKGRGAGADSSNRTSPPTCSDPGVSLAQLWPRRPPEQWTSRERFSLSASQTALKRQDF